MLKDINMGMMALQNISPCPRRWQGGFKLNFHQLKGLAFQSQDFVCSLQLFPAGDDGGSFIFIIGLKIFSGNHGHFFPIHGQERFFKFLPYSIGEAHLIPVKGLYRCRSRCFRFVNFRAHL